MAENRRDRDKRYYFTLGQMVLLGATFTLTAVVIFFLGIFIGKGIEARKMTKPEEPLIKMPVRPSAGSAGTAGAAPKEELTFYDTLTKSPEEGKVKEEKAPGKASKREAKETTLEANKGSLPLSDATKGTKEPLGNKPEARPQGAAGAQKPTDNKAEKARPSVEVAKATPASENGEQKQVGKIWSVQLNAFPDERSAKQLVDRLKNKGYNAVVSEARNKGKVWYRVRVGKYSSRDEADKALQNFKTKENFDKAFATSRQ